MSDLPPQRLLQPLERQQLVLEAPGRHAFGDRLDDAADAPFDCVPFPLQLLRPGDLGAAEAIDLGHELRGAGLEELRIHEMGLEAVEHVSGQPGK